MSSAILACSHTLTGRSYCFRACADMSCDRNANFKVSASLLGYLHTIYWYQLQVFAILLVLGVNSVYRKWNSLRAFAEEICQGIIISSVLVSGKAQSWLLAALLYVLLWLCSVTIKTFVCLFVLEFYGPVNNEVMSSRSVNSGSVPGQA